MDTVTESALPQPGSLGSLLRWNLGACVAIFVVLQLWRPCFFLTDDNLSGLFPVMTEVGRHLKLGESPFISTWLFGGHYNWLRDAVCPIWHPFYLLPALLCDTPARFWMVDLGAFCSLLLTTLGMTLLAGSLRAQFNPGLRDRYVIFYTLSFVFSSYVLITGPSWVNFLFNQSALPWLTLGILSGRLWRGIGLVALFTVHELLGGYAAMTVSNGLCLSLFAVAVCVGRRSVLPLVIWYAGNLIAALLLAPYLMGVADGFVHSQRAGVLPVIDASRYKHSARVFPAPFSPATGRNLPRAPWAMPNWKCLFFPTSTSLLACGAAWCVLPALIASPRWRPMESSASAWFWS